MDFQRKLKSNHYGSDIDCLEKNLMTKRLWCGINVNLMDLNKAQQ